MINGIKHLQDSLFESTHDIPWLSVAVKRLLAKRVSVDFYPMAQTKLFSLNATSGGNATTDLLLGQNFQWDFSSKKVTLSRKKQVSLWIKLVLQFTASIVLISRRPQIRTDTQTRVNLVFGLSNEQIWRDKNLKDLHSFFTQERLDLGGADNLYVIQGADPFRSTKSHKNLFVTGNNYLFLAANFLSPSEKIQLLSSAILRLIRILRLSTRSPHTVLVGLSYAIEEPLIEFILKKGILSVAVTTPSQLICQPLIFEVEPSPKCLRKIMIWYAANAVPLEYIETNRDPVDSSIYCCPAVDEHWVWAKYHANYLNTISGIPCIIKGSMLFYPRTHKSPGVDSRMRAVTIFDVTPFENLESPTDLYSAENMINFILAIVTVTKELEKLFGRQIPINIKQKRAYEAKHSKEYIRLINRLQAEGTLHVNHPENDIYSIIQDSIAVICVPLTSPALIAREENIPVCYFSTFEALRIPTEVDYIPVIRSSQGLQDFLQSSLRRSQES